MNRIILRPSDLSNCSINKWSEPGSLYNLTDNFRMKHLKEIIRIAQGDELRVCLINWGNGTCLVESVDSDCVCLRLIKGKYRLNNPLGLLLGLCRPPSMRKVIEHSTGMGVTHFFIVKCALSEKSYLKSSLLKSERLAEILDLGIAQDHNVSRMPEVHIFDTFRDFIIHSDKYLDSFESKLVFNQNASHWMQAKDVSTCLAIGPERGFTPGELKQLTDLNFIETKVSESVLRVEHACFYGLAQLEFSRSFNS